MNSKTSDHNRLCGMLRLACKTLFFAYLILFLWSVADASADESAYTGAPVAEDLCLERLADAFHGHEAVTVILKPQQGAVGQEIVITVQAVTKQPLNDGSGTPVTWTSRISSPFRWQVAQHLLSSHRENLRGSWLPDSPNPDSQPAGILIFHFPHEITLDLQPALRLTAAAQKYLMLSGESVSYGRRRVLIVQEPHFNAADQFALFKGLEIFFGDNPSLLEGGQTAFLAEGCAARTTISCQPLLQVAPVPDDVLIAQVLQTFLIPGYLAFEWKHQWGIPVLGTEDPLLYQISARIWTQLRNNETPESRVIWPQTVAARNLSMVQTLVAQLNVRRVPVLFVGGMHLLSFPRQTSEEGWLEAANVLTPGELGRLRASTREGIAQLLEERGIGYYLLTAHANVISSDHDDGYDRYESLFRAQLSRNLVGYLHGLKPDGVTVSPSPEAAAEAANAFQAARKKSGQSGNKDGEKPDGAGAASAAMQNALEKLLVLLSDIFNGRPPGDPSKCPGPGWEWIGQDPPGGARGAWHNKDSKESLRPHFGAKDHADHYDYSFRSSKDSGWRIYLDGTVERK